MLDKKWTVYVASALVALSAVLYFIHFLLFQDPHHIAIFLVGDLAFLPIEVLLVTLILHQLLESRDRRLMLEKLNMVIGTFFSVMGTRLLAICAGCDPRIRELQDSLIVSDTWSDADFERVSGTISKYSCNIDSSTVNLSELKDFLAEKEMFMVRLLENPVLLEHEQFTELMRAIFHLTEELAHRQDTSILPDHDRSHLSGDLCRAYGLLIVQWLDYMHHLKTHYPYLFSLAMRTNPFDRTADPVIP